MRREYAGAEAVTTGRVVHVVGRVTDEVFSFLGPATHALGRTGLRQSVVLVDDVRHRHHLVSLDESAELVLTPRVDNALQQWQAVMRAVSVALAAGGPVHAVHLHGLLPWMVGAWAVRRAGLKVPVFYSPHGSRSLGTLRTLGTVALWLLRPVLRTSRSAAIVNVPQETHEFDRWRSVDLVESPVPEAFFDVARNEARHPLAVTGGHAQGARSAELMAQLAVLMSGEDLRMSFNWFGAVDPVSKQRLTAAGVGVFDRAGDTEYASRLAAGWMYVAPGGTRGFPLCLVEAMAVGLPCVALDCEQHRGVIRDGETGFLCATERDMMQRIAQLIDSPELRERIGAAARAEARDRFGVSTFTTKLLAAYAASPAIAS